MGSQRVSVRAFGVVQGAIFLVVVVTFILHRRRAAKLNEDIGLQLNAQGIRASIHRTEVPESEGSVAPPLQIPTALPVWSKQTPAHEILGVAINAGAAEVEAAYKKLLKQYHPDRFASWGKGYQNRAHQTVIVLQDARLRMLGPKKKRS